MKLLIITGLHPTKKNNMSGIFVSRFLKKMRLSGVQFDVYSFIKKESLLIQLAKKLLKRPLNSSIKSLTYDGITFNFITIKVGLINRLLFNTKYARIAFKELKKHLEFDSYDLIPAHWVYPEGYIASLIKRENGKPYIVTAHGCDINSNPRREPKTLPFVLSALEESDKSIFVSERLLDAAKELGYSGAKNAIISMGVDVNTFSNINKEIARTRLGLKNEHIKYVGAVCSLEFVKGADRLPGIFKEVAQRYDNVSFIIVGDGELRGKIESKCLEYQLDVTFAGQVDPKAVHLWLNAIDVLVMPSRNEGFGVVALEAQACGCPVVGMNVGGIPEAIGAGGIVIDNVPGFEKDFGYAVVKMLNEPIPQEELRKRALQFDWDVIVKKYLDIYKEII